MVTPQLVACFDRALSLVATSLTDGRSKSTYLHASFGAGKTAMMSVLHLLLQGDPTARSIPELAPVVARYADRIDGRRFLLVPYHFLGRNSMEQEVLGGYIEHVRRLHPDAPLPPVYVADGILPDRCDGHRVLLASGGSLPPLAWRSRLGPRRGQGRRAEEAKPGAVARATEREAAPWPGPGASLEAVRGGGTFGEPGGR
ncbi:MAG TPA: hypothetical protein VMD59_23775 [Acidimicrobiales bacterium]|nr:hypothetical protein [Acidimicrobiales bacterium]